MAGSIIKVILATFSFAVIHSFLASRAAKEASARWLGRRQRNALYRPFYLAQSVVTLTALGAYLWNLPDQTLYKAKGPLALLMRLGQLAGLVYAAYAAFRIGISRLLGWTGFTAWLKREATVPPEPEAQGPSLDEEGHLQAAGPFTWSRHPLNFAPIPIFWLNPVMTLKLAAFNLAATLYLVLGSIHEETRLLTAYGPVYIAYQHSGVPFYIPSPRPVRPS